MSDPRSPTAGMTLAARAPELLASLKALTDRFQRCLIATGTDADAAALAVTDALALIASVEGLE